MTSSISASHLPFAVAHTFECDDDYGQPSARTEYSYHATRDEAVQAMAASSADFGARIEVRASRTDYYAYVARQRLVARTAGLRVATYKPFGDWSAS